MRIDPEVKRSLFTLRRQIADMDYQEVVNFSFVEEAWERDFAGNNHPIRLRNPIASQFSVMRSTLIGSLVANVRYNLNRKVARIRVFEFGAVYQRDVSVENGPLSVGGYSQSKRLAVLAYGPLVEEQWGQQTRSVDYFDIKADLESLMAPIVPCFVPNQHPALHPGRSATIMVDGRPVGFIGELHPRLQQRYELAHSPVLFEVEAQILQQRALPVHQELSKYPAVTRDLAVVVEQRIQMQVLLDDFELEVIQNPLCKSVQAIVLFDEYRGAGLPAGEKSLAFRFTLQDTQSTLQDDKVDAAMAAMMSSVTKKHGAKLRT
jgi:phenylalanyl-tRNA synthetase beta chain